MAAVKIVCVFGVGFMIVGIPMFLLAQPEWSGGEAFYFCVITLSTVGLGDLVPALNWGTVLWWMFYIVVRGGGREGGGVQRIALGGGGDEERERGVVAAAAARRRLRTQLSPLPPLLILTTQQTPTVHPHSRWASG